MKSDKINFLNSIRKYEFLLTSTSVLFFIIFLTFKLLIPNLIKASEIHKNGQILKSRFSTLENKEKILSGIDEKSMRENFVKLNFVLPASKDYVLLFTTLDQLQQKSGVSITRTDFELGNVSTNSAKFKNNPKGDSFVTPISVEIIGTIEQIKEFINQLSNLSGRLILIDNIKLTLLDFGLIKASMNGNTYFNPLPKSLGAVESKIPEFNQNYQELFNQILENQYPLEILEEDKDNIPVGKNNLFL